MTTNNTNTMNIKELENEGRRAVQAFMAGIKVKLHRTHTAEEAINDGDQARTTVLGKLNELINTYDALGIHKLTCAYRECIEKATVNNKTSLLMLGRALDVATDDAIADLEEDVQYCLENDIPATNAIKALATVRCLKTEGHGFSVPGALVRVLLYVVQATVNKVSKWLGLQAEGTIWCALGKALKCFAGILRIGVTIVRKVVKGVACYAVAGATKLGQMFMRAFYICVGALATWAAGRNGKVDQDVEAAADELFEEYMQDFDCDGIDGDYESARVDQMQDEEEEYFDDEPVEEETPKKNGLFGRFFRR